MTDLLSAANFCMFVIYIYCNRSRLGFIEAYSFNWFFAFLSFEFFPWYLDSSVESSAKLSYLFFFTSTSLLLVLFSVIRFKPVKNLTRFIVPESQFNNASFFKTAYWFCFLFVLLTLFHRYQTGSLVLGVDYQINTVSTLSKFIDYFLMLLGFNHTGYWFYMGLLSISFVIYKLDNNIYYFLLSICIMSFISAVTTQKTYFLFSLISVVVLFIYFNKGMIKQIFIGIAFSILGSGIILLLNNIRYIQKGNDGSVFDYFDLKTVIWYISLRLDYASSAAVIINNHFIDGKEYLLEILKSFLFFLPKSILFDGEIYGVRIAQLISYSENEKAGLSFIPYAHFYEMMGWGGVVIFSFVCSSCYAYFSAMFSKNNRNIYILYYLYMVPLIYYSSLTAPLHENIYIFIRSSFSFVLFVFMCNILHKIRLKV
ncbi:O-antigen polymerase [Shewanella baltica]|uniref:O-antigen polymerase n=1 Tax=Shewanella baltica TaxID=62322 RepID=UPI000D39BA87|nr:O-antigen polymerase [Shewanella baltica]